jgi:hypothetical protein
VFGVADVDSVQALLATDPFVANGVFGESDVPPVGDLGRWPRALE